MKRCAPTQSVTPSVAPDVYPVWVVFRGVTIVGGFLRDWLEWLERNHRGGQSHPEDDVLDFIQCCLALRDARCSVLPCLGAPLLANTSATPYAGTVLGSALPTEVLICPLEVSLLALRLPFDYPVCLIVVFADKGKAITPDSDLGSGSESAWLMRDEDLAHHLA